MSILKNINYIKEMNIIGCAQPDIYITIETGFQAAVPALLSLLVPGCTDIVKTKLGLSPWHRRGIRALIKGARAPFALEANKFLYKIGYFTAEAGLYWFMVADIATEFVTTWQSFAFAAEQCPLPSAGTAYGYIQPFFYAAEVTSKLGTVPEHTVPGMSFGPSWLDVFPGFQGTIAFSTTWDSVNPRGEPVDVETWLTEEEDGPVQSLFRTNNPASQPHNETVGHLSFDTLGKLVRKRYHFHMHNNSDVIVQPVAGSWTLNLSGHPSGVFPFGCKFKPVSIPFL